MRDKASDKVLDEVLDKVEDKAETAPERADAAGALNQTLEPPFATAAYHAAGAHDP